LTDDGTLWFPELTEDHGRRDGAWTIVDRNSDGSLSGADNARQSEEHDTAVLRAELCVPDAWVLESVSYDLGAFLSHLDPFRLVVHGTRIVAHTVGDDTSSTPTQIFTVDHGVLEWPASEAIPIHPCAAFVDDDLRTVVTIGGLLNAPELHAAGRLPLYFYLLALSQRIYRPGSPVYAERRWHPTLGKREYIGGRELTQNPNDVSKAERSFSIFDDLTKLYSKGGSPTGPRKGQVWSRRQCLEWWASWTTLDGPPTQKKLAVDMGLSKKNPETAVERWRDTGLHWPPTEEEREELDEEEDE
jgi:hypothetical protein